MILAPLLQVLLSSNILLSDRDPQPWERLGATEESTLEDSVRTAARRVVATSRNAAGTALSRDTADHWIDSRGRCISRRTWTFDDSTRSRSLREWGMRTGLPSDSAWLETWTESVPTRRDRLAKSPVPGLHLGASLVESPFASALPDSIVLQLDQAGRLRSRQDRFRYWTRSLWAELDSSGAPSRWGDDALSEWSSTETHHPRWEGTRLVWDSIVQVAPGAADAPDTTIRRFRCTWEDSRLMGCRTPLEATPFVQVDTNAAPPLPETFLLAPHRPIDSVTVVRNLAGQAIELRSTLGNVARQTWDDQGRLRSRHTRVGVWFRLDSLDYLGDSRLPSQRRTGLVSALDQPIANTPGWDTLTEYAYTTTALSGVAVHRMAGLSPRLEGRTLRIDGSAASASLRVSDPSGRVLATATGQAGHLTLALPAGSRLLLWDVRDARGTVIGQGRLTALR